MNAVKWLSLLKEHVSISIYILFLSIGCFWQILDVCEMYYNYPTNIFIETEFETLVQPIPAMTFCFPHGLNSNGKNSSDFFEELGDWKNNLFSYIAVTSITDQTDPIPIKDKLLAHAIERVGQYYYCLTLNSKLKSEFYQCFD